LVILGTVTDLTFAILNGTQINADFQDFYYFICVYLRKSASKKIKVMPVGSIGITPQKTNREYCEWTNGANFFE